MIKRQVAILFEAFTEFSIILVVSALAGAISVWIRQPVLIAYIVVGIVVGPSVLNLSGAHEQINLLAQVGVSVLLFAVGLKLDISHVKHIGPVALATGLGQLGFTIIFGFMLLMVMGKDIMFSIYVAVALTFSSTIIIVKLLSDKREIDSLHGRIAVGFLIVQDLAVVVAMMAMSTMNQSQDSGQLQMILMLLLRISVAAVALYVLMKHILPRVIQVMARSQELLVLFAIAWGTGLAALGEWAGFSKEAGAFLAGFSLASSGFSNAIHAKLTSIRDFLLLFFFIDLGSKLDFSTLGGEIWPAVVLSIFVLVGNPLIVLAIMGFMGYRKRTGFLAGLTVAQISEFSIVFVAMGITMGHIGNDALGLTTMVGLVTITLSTYMILYSHPLYDRLSRFLSWFERKDPYRESLGKDTALSTGQADVLVVGMGRYGRALASGLEKSGLNVVGVDFDPEIITGAKSSGVNILFGDVTDPAFAESLPLRNLRWVVSALPDLHSNQGLIRALSEMHFEGHIAAVVRDESDGPILVSMGVQEVLFPVSDAVDHAVQSIHKLIVYERSEHAPST